MEPTAISGEGAGQGAVLKQEDHLRTRPNRAVRFARSARQRQSELPFVLSADLVGLQAPAPDRYVSCPNDFRPKSDFPVSNASRD